MPFGKHRGERISEIPADYLRWVLNSCDIASPELKGQIRAHLGGSGPAASPFGSTSRKPSSWDTPVTGGYVPPSPPAPPAAPHRTPAPVCTECGVGGFLDRNGRCGICGSSPSAEKLSRVQQTLRDAVNRWRRDMARKHHPDVGGSLDLMVSTNTAADDLLVAIDAAFV